jgi:hypothetical protein
MKVAIQKIFLASLFVMVFVFLGTSALIIGTGMDKILAIPFFGGMLICLVIVMLWRLPEEHYTQETTIQQAETEAKRGAVKRFFFGKPRTCEICGKPTFERAPLCPEDEKLLTCPNCNSTKMYYCKPTWPSKGQYNCAACEFPYATFNLFISIKNDEAVQRVKEKNYDSIKS